MVATSQTRAGLGVERHQGDEPRSKQGIDDISHGRLHIRRRYGAKARKRSIRIRAARYKENIKIS